MKTMLYIIVLLLALGAGYWLGKSSVEVTTTETVRIDTVFYAKPDPIRILPPTFALVKVPRLLFAPRDTVFKTTLSNGTDSVEIPVTIAHKQYGDSTYRAQVSGPSIGGMGPSLDWIEVYNRTITQTQTTTKRSRFAVTAGVGVGYTPRGFQPYVGVGVGVVLWRF